MSMLVLFAVWLALLATLLSLAVGKKGDGGALTLAYFLGLSLIHVPGLLVFMGSASSFSGKQETEVGFELTLLGMGAFIVGGIMMRRINDRRQRVGRPVPRTRFVSLETFGKRAIVIGAISYFVLLPVSHAIASLPSIIGAVATLLIVGLWLRLYSAHREHDRRKLIATLALLPLLPLSTLATGGFLGYGIYWLLSVVCLHFILSNHKSRYYFSAPVAVILGLSLFVAYMGERGAIRELEWNENASMGDRLQRMSMIVTNLHPFDIDSPSGLTAINDRLNQNYFVGAGVMRHREGISRLSYGATVPVWTLLPRAIWPDKPAVGGGGDLVTRFTGIALDPNASFGVGQVLEFYMNFGVPGVIGGFFGLGLLLMRLDQGVMRALSQGDMPGLMIFALPGLTVLQPGGNLLEIVVAFAAAVIVARLLGSLEIFGHSGENSRGWIAARDPSHPHPRRPK